MKKTILTTIIALGLLGCSQNTPTPQKTTVVSTTPSKQITILGTYNWDVESGKLGSSKTSDFWYRRIDSNSGHLVAKNAATIEVVDLEYSAISKEDITSRPVLRDGRIAPHNLKVGTVAIFKTAEGNYGKLRIKGFRALHDFSFKEAQDLTQQWRAFVLKKPNTQKYHLVVEYQLFR
jgi:hypothetical protein